MRTKAAFLVALALLLVTWAAPFAAFAAEGAGNLGQADQTLEALLPEDGAVPGWKTAESPVLYGPHNLWDFINGAAALYLDYGFRSLATAYYKTTDGQSTTALEVYRMETPLHAFAIYAAERSHEEDFVKIGVEGYLDEKALNFWKGPYYTKVTSYGTAEDSKRMLRKLAGIVASRIPGQYTEPEAFRFFPIKGRVPKSERYIPRNFLGYPFFKAGYRVDYRNGQGSYQLFLVPNGSPTEAEQAFTMYREHLAPQDAGLTSDKKGEYRTMSTTDGKTVFLYGSYVGGIFDEPDEATASKVVAALIAALKKSNPKN